MTIAATPSLALPSAHHDFLAALPGMQNAIGFALRKLPRRYRVEAVRDAFAAGWHAWAGLLRRGKDPLAVGPVGIADNAVRYVLAGRRLGTETTGRGAADVFTRIIHQAPEKQAPVDV